MANVPIYGRCFPINPDDNALLPVGVTGIYVGATGTIVITGIDGTDVTFAAVPTGTILPIQAKRVKSTGTGATLLVGMIG